jgi:nickel-dependent lactate racemase
MGASLEDDFQRDLDEIAQMVGLNTIISLQVNANREIIHMSCGDRVQCFGGSLAFSKKVLRARALG